LKGAAGSYGFGQIAVAAAAVETACESGKDSEELEKEIKNLVTLCRSARGPILSSRSSEGEAGRYSAYRGFG
jgi:HPt (histidine-containing phosphotransfer) domain-containing protein